MITTRLLLEAVIKRFLQQVLMDPGLHQSLRIKFYIWSECILVMNMKAQSGKLIVQMIYQLHLILTNYVLVSMSLNGQGNGDSILQEEWPQCILKEGQKNKSGKL